MPPGVCLAVLIPAIFILSDNRDEHLPRTCVLAFLSRLDPSNVLHQRLMENLVTDLLEKVYYTEWKLPIEMLNPEIHKETKWDIEYAKISAIRIGYYMCIYMLV